MPTLEHRATAAARGLLGVQVGQLCNFGWDKLPKPSMERAQVKLHGLQSSNPNAT